MISPTQVFATRNRKRKIFFLHYSGYTLLPVYVTFTENTKLTKLDSFDCKERWFPSNDGETTDEFARLSDVQHVLNEIHDAHQLVMLANVHPAIASHFNNLSTIFA